VKLEHLHIAGFGRLIGLDIEFGEGLTVVVGPNEAGKSTIVECLLRLLFGFPGSQFTKKLKRFEPWSGMPYGASLRYRMDDGRIFEVERDFGKADVPTKTFEADTRRPVAALSGNKSASPGESALSISLDVYRAAAVVLAGDFNLGTNGATGALADRLAAVVGAAGEASAAKAIERLKKAHADIGSSGPNTPLGKATRDADEAEAALRRARDDRSGFSDNVQRHAELTEQVSALTSQRASCGAAFAAARLQSVRARIGEAEIAERSLDDALASRNTVISASPKMLSSRADIESTAEALRIAQAAAADVATRADASTGKRDAIQRDVDGASAALLEKRASVARLDEIIAAHEAAAAGRPAISTETLAEMEREADAVDAAEGRARTLETEAAIARQRSRPAPFPIVAAVIASLAFAAAWFPSHLIILLWLALGAGALAIVAAVSYARAARKRNDAISRAESAASEALEENAQAALALGARCRRLGCANVAAVRAARTAQAEIDRVRAERAAAADAATHLTEKRDAIAQRLVDVNAVDAERTAALARVARSSEVLTTLLDDVDAPSGSIDERLTAYRRLLEAGKDALQAEATIANARASLERALRGASIEALQAEATRHAASAASGVDPGDFAKRSEADLERESKRLDAQLRDAERALDDAQGRITGFDELHPIPAAELEERAAAVIEIRDRLRAVRKSAEIAWTTIEAVKDVVHRDFTPVLNDAISKSAAAMTGGRYAQAFVDQRDLIVRVRVPETGGSEELEQLSTGTIEQFQFALRAALASALGSGERVPILYDDALAHADDDRLRAALERAAALAQEGDQIVFFTQRGVVEEFAANLHGVRHIRLPGPGE
jgi:energy-coupling factor transporter ATP-binding protein EcfA2